MRVFIVAEMSANHCGDKEIAKKIITAAKDCGADAVKLQTYTADTLTLDCDNEIFHTTPGSLWEGTTMYKLYQQAQTPWEWHGGLKAFADSIGIELFSSPFDYSAVDFLESILVTRYKIASPEAMDYPLIAYAAKFGKPMIISTGMVSLEEIQCAVDTCKKIGNNDITLLKCTSEYPAPLKHMNLKTIPDLISRFAPQGVKVGLSDHSMRIEPVVAAVALGAVMIEKHFTLDRSLGGVDSGFSLNLEEFREMVQAIRNTEKVLGSPCYQPDGVRKRGARSLFVTKNIKAGQIFTPKNVRSIRPSNGLHPKYYKIVLGKTAVCDIPFGTPLAFEHIQERLN
jgi:N-acetylneuraminate synthase/pseudaminic acid synthase